jgi:hypothetical protein
MPTEEDKRDTLYDQFQARFGFDVRDPEQRERALEELLEKMLAKLEEEEYANRSGKAYRPRARGE